MDSRSSDDAGETIIEMARPAPAAPAPAAQISYEPAQPAVSRRAFRMLLLLTLLNTVMLGGYVLGPAFQRFGKEQWDAYKQRQAEQKAAAALAASRASAMAVERAALAYAPAPPGTLVYDDNGTRPGGPDAPPAAATTQPAPLVPWPAAAPQPAPYLTLPATAKGWGRLVNPAYVVLFMQERRASLSSAPRLALVLCDPELLLRPSAGDEYGRRDFLGLTFRTTTAADDFAGLAYTYYEWKPTQRPPGDPLPEPALRLFAGQPDAADPSRLVIPYELGGTRGQILGKLYADDTLQLTPDGPLAQRWKVRTIRSGL
jgi:hypothetical protein